jgi:hypothetical protein
MARFASSRHRVIWLIWAWSPATVNSQPGASPVTRVSVSALWVQRRCCDPVDNGTMQLGHSML